MTNKQAIIKGFVISGSMSILASWLIQLFNMGRLDLFKPYCDFLFILGAMQITCLMVVLDGK